MYSKILSKYRIHFNEIAAQNVYKQVCVELIERHLYSLVRRCFTIKKAICEYFQQMRNNDASEHKAKKNFSKNTKVFMVTYIE